MLRIQRTTSAGPVYSLSGRIETEDILELQRLLSLEAADQQIAFDLLEITRVDQDAVGFLATCEAKGIKLEHCPTYIREWLDIERRKSSSQQS